MNCSLKGCIEQCSGYQLAVEAVIYGVVLALYALYTQWRKRKMLQQVGQQQEPAKPPANETTKQGDGAGIYFFPFRFKTATK